MKKQKGYGKFHINRVYRDLIDYSDEGICYFNAQGNCILANEEAKRILAPLEEPYGAEEVLTYIGWAEAEGENPRRCKVHFGGTDYHYVVEYREIRRQNKSVASYLKMRDYTEEMAVIETDRYAITHDSFTGLLSREGFFERVDEKLAQGADGVWMMLCSNIKDFKVVNKILGNTVGDKILLEEARLLKNMVRRDSIYGRIIDDKFALFVRKEYFREEIVKSVLEKMQGTMRNNMYRMHVHVGIYEMNNGPEKAQDMYNKAKIAMDAISGNYHQIFSYYNSVLMERQLSEMRFMTEFERALDERQFVIYLQAHTSFNGRADGAEALVRWKHPEKGILPPARFISILEDSGQIRQLDQYVWEEAVRLLRDWKDRGYEEYYISVNVSIKDILYRDMYEVFTNLVETYEVNPARLHIEITETVLIVDMDKIISLIKRLRAYGFVVMIDDFGTGYSSFYLLRNIEADVLKIDMEFLQKQNDNDIEKNYKEIVLRTVIQIARELSMDVIAEGVETEEQARLLVGLGCRRFQGYYFHRPESVDEFEKKYFRM